MTYTQLLNQALELLDEEGADEAYQLVKQEWKQVANTNEAQLYNLAYCFAALSGCAQEALGLLKEAVYTKGFWYDYEYLIQDEDLESLRAYSEFETMAQLCKERQQTAQKAAKPLLVQDGEMQVDKPFLLVLHGDQQNAKMTVPYWQAAKESGYALYLAQSSQMQMSDGYLWDDEEQAAEEICAHCKDLQNQGADCANSILCGFSSGGRAAFYATVTGKVSPKGLILVAPWLPELDEWTEDLDALKKAGTKVYLCCGDADEDCFEGTEELFEILDDNGVEVEFKLIPDLDHDYPKNFEQILQDAVRFVRS